MLWKYFGTLMNVLTVILGSCIGLVMRRRKPKAAENAKEPLSHVMMPCLGLCTVFAAASGILGPESGSQALVVVLSMVAGLLIGHGTNLDDRLNGLCDRLTSRMKRDGNENSPAVGLVTACLLFCIGSMTILGSFEGAMNPADRLDLNCHTTLLIKSLLDFVSATCLSTIYGPAVMLSAVFVLLFQGLLTLLASAIQPFLVSINVLPMMNCAGSLVLLVIAINLLGLKKMKTANYLPAIFLPILICWVLSLFGIVL